MPTGHVLRLKQEKLEKIDKGLYLEMVYLIEIGNTGFLKIGFTGNIIQRIKALQLKWKDNKLKVITTILAGKDLEQNLHKQFEKFRVIKEYYKDNIEIREKFISLLNERNG